MVGRRMPEESREAHGLWAIDLCRISDWNNPTAASSLVDISIYLRPSPHDLTTAREMAAALMSVNSLEDHDQPEASETYPIVNQSTASVVTSCLLRLVDSVLVELDWSLLKLNALTSEKLTLEEAVYSRSEALVNILSHLVQMNLTGELQS